MSTAHTAVQLLLYKGTKMSIDVSYQIASLESRSDGKSFLSKFKAFFHLVSRDYFKKLSPEVSFLSTKPSNVSKIDYMTIRKRSVLFKWKASIAGFLTNPRELITGASTGHIEWIDPKEIKTELGKVYDEDVSQVGDAFGNLYRNMNEFSMAQKIINNAVELVQTESPIAVEKEVAEINDLLNQLLDTISENDDVTMSKSTEAFLVEGLNQQSTRLPMKLSNAIMEGPALRYAALHSRVRYRKG